MTSPSTSPASAPAGGGPTPVTPAPGAGSSAGPSSGGPSSGGPTSGAAAEAAPDTVSRFTQWLGPVKARVVAYRRQRAATKAPGSKKLLITLALTLIGLLVSFTLALGYLFSDPTGKTVTFDQLTGLAASGRIHSAVFLDEDSTVVATITSVDDAKAAAGARKNLPPFTVAGVSDAAATVKVPLASSGSVTKGLADVLAAGGARVSFEHQDTQARVRVVTEFLMPVLILANLFALLFLGKGSGGGAIGEVTNFGKVDDGSRTGGSAITFKDVGGADEALVELAEVRDYLRNPAKYKVLGATPPKGVLLFGPPGTGKTLLAKAVAGEAGVPFFSVAGAEFVESLVGVGAARIRDLFKRVNAVAPAIIFIDELDALGRKRGSGGGGGGSDEREQTLNQLLVEMDGFDVSTGVVVIAATNRPDILDPALMRPGRFDRHITVERPDAKGRERILGIHAGKKPLADDVDLERVASRCPGFTGADLASVVNEAALLTIRQGGAQIHQKELEEAIVRVMEGPQRRGRVLTPEERLRAAYHEIGHVVVAATLGRLEDLHRVTILGRGRIVAAATFGDSEATLQTRTDLHNQLVAALAGVAAEDLVLGEGSTGAEQDLEHATELARDMVTRYGMSGVVGLVRLQMKAGEGFLGSDSQLVDLSPQTQREVEQAVSAMIDQAHAEATAVLITYRRELDDLAAHLEAEETLEDEGLQAALAPMFAALAPRRTSAAAATTAAPSTTALPRQRRTAKPAGPSPSAGPVKPAGTVKPVAVPTRKRT